MTSLILSLVLGRGQLDSVFARYTAKMRAMPSFEVQVATKSGPRVNFTADFVLDGRSRLLYDAPARGGRYILTITPAAYREVDYGSRCYDVFPWQGPVAPAESRISDLPKLIPYWLMLTDFRRYLPKVAKSKYGGKTMVDGEPCDIVQADYEVPGGKGTVQVAVDDAGLMKRYYFVADSMGHRQEVEWTFKHYLPLQKIADARFANPIPDGFMPYGLEDHILPIAVGKKPSLSGWVAGSTGRPWTAPKGPLLFVLTTAGEIPSQKALAALKSWAPELKARNVTVALASDSASAQGSGGLLVDPDQRSVRSLAAPSTPMFYLLDSSGTVRNLWMGFPREAAAKMHSDLLAAAASLK